MNEKKEQRMNGLLNTINAKLLGVAIVALVIGYILLAQGPANNPLSKSVAPIILVISYFVLIPCSIIFAKKIDSK
jgi:hypothetical protein